jgi:multidrug efflux pump subunit AcrB
MIPLSIIVDIQQRQQPLVIRRRNGSRMVKLVVQPASQNQRQRIEREVRTIGENLKPRMAGEDYRMEVE